MVVLIFELNIDAAPVDIRRQQACLVELLSVQLSAYWKLFLIDDEVSQKLILIVEFIDSINYWVLIDDCRRSLHNYNLLNYVHVCFRWRSL